MSIRFGSEGVPIERLEVSAYKVPTDSPESEDSNNAAYSYSAVPFLSCKSECPSSGLAILHN